MRIEPTRTLIIANPAANGGRVGKLWPEISEMLARELPGVPVEMTRAPGHARELARRAVWSDKRTILSLGGDGTHSEVVSGVVRVRPEPGSVTVGILPFGTGGDFRRMLHGSRELGDHARLLHSATPQAIDVGMIACASSTETSEHLFLNEASVGISGTVCERVNASRKVLGGSATYLVATLGSLPRFTPPTVRLTVDGQEVGVYPITTIMLSNGQFAGAGMHFAPSARLADGMLDITVLRNEGLPKLLASMPALYRGELADRPVGQTFRGFTASIELVHGVSPLVEADGEVIGTLPIQASVLPGAIQILGMRPDVL